MCGGIDSSNTGAIFYSEDMANMLSSFFLVEQERRLSWRGERMTDSTRARVAAAVASAAKEKTISSVYDYAGGRYRRTSASTSGSGLSGFDYDTGTHFSGGGGGRLDFFDYQNSAHVQLKLEGNQFSGFDYHTSSHFSGSVSGSAISLYDYQTGRHYSFSV
jgi:hypothetical protein